MLCGRETETEVRCSVAQQGLQVALTLDAGLGWLELAPEQCEWHPCTWAREVSEACEAMEGTSYANRSAVQCLRCPMLPIPRAQKSGQPSRSSRSADWLRNQDCK